MIHVQQIAQKATAYPVAVVYCVAALMLAAAVQDFILLLIALTVLALIAAVVVVVAVHKETVRIINVIDHEHDRLIARCEQLSATLSAYGHEVPPRPVYPED